MKFIIRFYFGGSINTIAFGSEEIRDEVFKKIVEADWEEPFLIEGTDGGHNASTVVNLSKVCHMSCINEEGGGA